MESIDDVLHLTESPETLAKLNALSDEQLAQLLEPFIPAAREKFADAPQTRVVTDGAAIKHKQFTMATAHLQTLLKQSAAQK